MLGILVAAALVLSGCSIYDVPLPGGPDTGKNPIKVTLMFRDVLDLVPQSTVKVNDVTVGKVTKVQLKGYVAKVTVALPRKVDLPDNATALIRQTSLLGEKFIDIEQPRNPSSNKLRNGDVIGLDRTGRNPEVEEVFGALALLLNGGGVGQLKTIATELNNAFGGRESEVRSVLDQIRQFTTTLDQNKSSVVQAIENTNRLAGELRKQDKTIKATLDDVPGALASINRQRDDLVRLLKSLTNLSSVGVKVIQASKASTIDSLQSLAPVLNSFAKAGENLPKAFQVFLTYPFVDAAVGNDPTVARNLHIGDYTNLSVNLNVDLGAITSLLPTVSLPPVVSQVCKTAKAALISSSDTIIDNLPTAIYSQADKTKLKNGVKATVGALDCDKVSGTEASDLVAALIQQLLPSLATPLCNAVPSNPLCDVLTGVSTPAVPITIPPGLTGALTNGTTTGGGLLGGGGLLPRAQLGKGYQVPTQIDPFGLAAKGYDPGVGTILFQGVATQK
jgi:phospholipid/cholesterol/gamma-HCH transport system substrate-binding protein